MKREGAAPCTAVAAQSEATTTKKRGASLDIEKRPISSKTAADATNFFKKLFYQCRGNNGREIRLAFLILCAAVRPMHLYNSYSK
jgi:hypothetical protein